MSRFTLSRRTLLRGAGVSLALPVLEAMAPVGRARAQTGGLRNFLAFFMPNGVDTARFHPPVGPLTAANLTAPLQDLVGFEREGVWPGASSVVDDVTIVRGVDHSKISRDIHVCSMALTAHVDRGSHVPSAPTLDQVLADHLGGDPTPFRNVVMSGTRDTAVTQGYLSFREGGQSEPGFRTPRAAFDALFGSGDSNADAQGLARKSSVIDLVLEDAHRLEQRLGQPDRQRLDQYLQSLYEIEMQLGGGGCEVPALEELGSSLHDMTKLFVDIAVAALSCDLTRVAVVQYSNSWDLNFSGYTLGENIGDWSDHFISHKLGDNDRATDLDGLPQSEAMAIANARVELTTRFKARRFANVIEALRNTPTPTGTLLDETLLLYASENADGDSHSRVNMPYMLAGGTAGGVRHGRVVDAAGAPTGALHASILRAFGMEVERYGDPETGPIADF